MANTTPTPEVKSPLHELIDTDLANSGEGDLRTFATMLRGQGKSWDDVVFEIRKTTERSITKTTLRAWLKDIA